MGDDGRARLEALAGPGGPLEIREAFRARWEKARAGRAFGPTEATVVEQLLPIQAHVLEWLYQQRVDVAPDDISWQDAPQPRVVAYFDITDEQYRLIVEDLQRLGLVDVHFDGSAGLTLEGIRFLQVVRPEV
ncbi:MAG: hypothetical protein FJW23_05195 [Acidimicrobiia bacterium]|nr:hypothetical protein [Acidimicrobiia bacterium]